MARGDRYEPPGNSPPVPSDGLRLGSEEPGELPVDDAESTRQSSSQVPVPEDGHFVDGLLRRDGGKSMIGPYEILGKIGAGTTGVVLRARHGLLERVVALKVLRPELATDSKFVARFLREARLAATIEHPNVVRVLDAGEWQGLLYQAHQLVEGGDLARKLRESGPFPPEEACRLVLACLGGLEAIHERGLIHRDIKPANILLDGEGRPLLSDLGLVRAVQDEGDRTALTTVGAPLGTPAYMSPEQARGESQVDGRSDLYSLGVTFFALLAGSSPYKGSTNYEVVANILFKPMADLEELLPVQSPGIRAVLARAMCKEREGRHQTAREFREDVEDLLAGRPPRHAQDPASQPEAPPVAAPEPEPPAPARPAGESTARAPEAAPRRAGIFSYFGIGARRKDASRDG